MNLKEELIEIIVDSDFDKPPFDDTAQLCEQICLRYTIEVLEGCTPNLWYQSHEQLIENKIKELKEKLTNQQ